MDVRVHELLSLLHSGNSLKEKHLDCIEEQLINLSKSSSKNLRRLSKKEKSSMASASLAVLHWLWKNLPALINASIADSVNLQAIAIESLHMLNKFEDNLPSPRKVEAEPEKIISNIISILLDNPTSVCLWLSLTYHL
jgi:hypothetical protein